MGCCGGGSDPSKAARQLENEKQSRITQGTADINQIFSGFNEPFYKQRQQAYVGYALPQFTRQFQDASNNLSYSLADRGLGRSGAQRKMSSDLGFQGNVQRQGIIDTGTQQANDLRKQVENQRSNLFSQLQISADPASSAQQALSSASNLTLPSTFAPLGNLFANYAKTSALNQQSQMYNQYTSALNSNNPLGAQPYSLTHR